MNQSAEMLHIEPYCYGGETAPADSCEDWLLVEVDQHGAPIIVEEYEDPQPDLALLEEQFSARVAEEARRSYEAGYACGRQDSHDAERDAQKATHAEQLHAIATAVGGMTESLAADRARHYERLEQEAVRLALAVAGRILRREAQMDPLFLLGTVRVALGQFTASTKVRLRVPAADAELWTEAMDLLPKREMKPDVTAAEDMRTGECVMETEFGSADLGVRAQMAEIERDLFDRSAEAIDSDPAAAVSLP
jgi:flagellar assembly protein FliH